MTWDRVADDLIYPRTVAVVATTNCYTNTTLWMVDTAAMVVAASTSECVDCEGNGVRGVRRAGTLGEIDNSGSVQKP